MSLTPWLNSNLKRRLIRLHNGNLSNINRFILEKSVPIKKKKKKKQGKRGRTGSSMKSKQYSIRENVMNIFFQPTFQPTQRRRPEPHPRWPCNTSLTCSFMNLIHISPFHGHHLENFGGTVRD